MIEPQELNDISKIERPMVLFDLAYQRKRSNQSAWIFANTNQ